MSLTVLQRVSAHIASISGITDWYEYYFAPITANEPGLGAQNLYFRWTDAKVNGTAPFFLFRQVGEGASDILVQSINVQITLVDNANNVVEADRIMQDIIRLFRGATTQPGVVRFDPVGGVAGPSYLENGRPVFTLTVRVFTEDL